MEKVMRNKLAIFVFVFPAALLFAAFIIIPIFMSGYYSTLKWNGATEGTFIGIQNFIDLFKSKSVGFPKTLVNVLLFTGLSVFIQLPIALVFALILSSKVKGEKFFISVFFFPVLMSTVVVGQLWSKIYNPNYGLLNSALQVMGLDHLTKTWLGDQKTALLAVLIPMLWQYLGYHLLLMYAGAKSISNELKEASLIDGATGWEVARYITIPLLKPVIRVSVIFAVTGSIRAFDLIYVLTGGGPAHASEVPSTLMVNMIFLRNRYGLGSAIALFIIAICFTFAVLIKKFFKTEEELDSAKKKLR